MFDRSIRETRWLVLLKRACVIAVAVYLVIGMISLYRAVTQIRSLEIQSEGSMAFTELTSGQKPR